MAPTRVSGVLAAPAASGAGQVERYAQPPGERAFLPAGAAPEETIEARWGAGAAARHLLKNEARGGADDREEGPEANDQPGEQPADADRSPQSAEDPPDNGKKKPRTDRQGAAGQAHNPNYPK